MIEHRAAPLRAEDLLLAAWLVVVEPFVLPPDASTGGSSPDLLRAGLGILGLVGLVVAVGARPAPGVTTALTVARPPLWVVAPLVGGAAVALEDTARAAGPADGGAILAMLLVGVAIAARGIAPPLPAMVRRALVTPFVLVTAGYLGEIIRGPGRPLDLAWLGSSLGSGQAAEAASAVAVAVVGAAAFFAMLVFAPRQVAEREGSRRAWALRFLVYLAALVAGATLASGVRS